MPLTNAARDLICQAIVGGSYVPFNNTNAYLGVGDSSVAFSNAQTDLQSPINKLRKNMASTYPQVSTNVITFKSSFLAGDANWQWNEHAAFNNGATGVMLYRAVQNLGTKTVGSTWDLTVTETITV